MRQLTQRLAAVALFAATAGLALAQDNSALVDIDPGLFQFWLSRGQLEVPRHDHYFTTGETVGDPASSIPDCGLPWIHVHPAVSLEHWSFALI